jgi:hypothetical protein
MSDKMKSLPNGLKQRLISSIVRDAVLEKAIEEALPQVEPQPEAASSENKHSPSATDSPSRKRKSGAAKKGKVKKPVEPNEEAEEVVEVAENKDIVTAATNGPVPSPPAPPEERNVPSAKSESTSSTEKHPEPSSPPAAESKSDTSEPVAAVAVFVGATATEPARPQIGTDMTDGCGGVRSHRTTAVAAAAADSKPPTPVQHSVFKSFFSTDLSIDDIDRQIEAKRMEWVSYQRGNVKILDYATMGAYPGNSYLDPVDVVMINRHSLVYAASRFPVRLSGIVLFPTGYRIRLPDTENSQISGRIQDTGIEKGPDIRPI